MQGEAPLRQQEYDYIVVGSGAGGAPVAANLARRGFTVALLDAGGSDISCDYSGAGVLFQGVGGSGAALGLCRQAFRQ